MAVEYPDDLYPLPNAEAWYCFLSLLIVMTFGLNAFNLVAFWNDQSLRQFGDYLIMNLSIADMIIGMCSMPPYVRFFVVGEWELGDNLCIAWVFEDYCATAVSGYTMSAISLHRYLMVAYPIWMRNHETTRLLLAFTLGPWMFAVLFYFPMIVLYERITGENYIVDNPGECDVPYRENPVPANIDSTFCLYVPFTLLIVFNIGVYKNIRTLQARKETRCGTPIRASRFEDGRSTQEFSSGAGQRPCVISVITTETIVGQERPQQEQKQDTVPANPQQPQNMDVKGEQQESGQRAGSRSVKTETAPKKLHKQLSTSADASQTSGISHRGTVSLYKMLSFLNLIDDGHPTESSLSTSVMMQPFTSENHGANSQTPANEITASSNHKTKTNINGNLLTIGTSTDANSHKSTTNTNTDSNVTKTPTNTDRNIQDSPTTESSTDSNKLESPTNTSANANTDSGHPLSTGIQSSPDNDTSTHAHHRLSTDGIDTTTKAHANIPELVACSNRKMPWHGTNESLASSATEMTYNISSSDMNTNRPVTPPCTQSYSTTPVSSPVSQNASVGNVAKMSVVAGKVTIAADLPTCDPNTTRSRSGGRISASNLKAAYALFVLVCTYGICWLPFQIISSIEDKVGIHWAIYEGSVWLLWCNSMLNPIIYTLFLTRFRAAHYRLARRLGCACSFYTTTTQTSSIG